MPSWNSVHLFLLKKWTVGRLGGVSACQLLIKHCAQLAVAFFATAIVACSGDVNMGLSNLSKQATIVLTSGTNKAWTYTCVGTACADHRSPDYKTYIKVGPNEAKNFTAYSYGIDEYEKLNNSLQHVQYNRPKHVKESESSVSFSFKGYVTVRAKVKRGAKLITLPLTGCKVYPSRFMKSCSVEKFNSSSSQVDTMVFDLEAGDEGKNWVLIANPDDTLNNMDTLKGQHSVVGDWEEIPYNDSYFKFKQMDDEVSEGFKNPLFIFGHPKETQPSGNILYVNPGDTPSRATMANYDIVWFKTGVHDMSYHPSGQNENCPIPYMKINGGQTYYIEGGAYVKGQFYKDTSDTGVAKLKGRGYISGADINLQSHQYIFGTAIENVDEVEGITLTDRFSFGLKGSKLVDNIAIIGAWHGNTGGIGEMEGDANANAMIKRSFLSSHDDCLKLHSRTTARNLVIYQGSNAHAIMVKEMYENKTYENTTAEWIDIIAYNKFPRGPGASDWQLASSAAIGIHQGLKNVLVKNFTFRKIWIDAPYIWRPFGMFSINNRGTITPNWWYLKPATSSSEHAKFKNITFEDIKVKSTLIGYKSNISTEYDNNTFDNILFKNIKINNTDITSRNASTYFQVDPRIADEVTFHDGD